MRVAGLITASPARRLRRLALGAGAAVMGTAAASAAVISIAAAATSPAAGVPRGAGRAATRGNAQRPAAAQRSAMSALMQGLATSVAQGAAAELAHFGVGWALTSLGISPDPDARQLAALRQIQATLLEMQQQLADITDLLRQQSCQNAANVADVRNALNAIDIWAGRGTHPAVDSYLGLIDYAERGVDVRTDMSNLFNAVLNGNGQYGPLPHLLVGLDNALRDQGLAPGVISACGLLVPPPRGGFDDRPYFQKIDDVAEHYAEYEARAGALIVEAYHWRALQAWLAAGHDPASLPADEVASICADATGQVLADCVRAEAGFDNIRTSMRAQYAEAGAPYSSGTPQHGDVTFPYDPADPVVRMQNATGVVWVMDINDFFAKSGWSTACQTSTSAYPCGPGVGAYNDTAFRRVDNTQPVRYGANGGYTTWQAATAADWETITAHWTGQNTTLGQLMRRDGFAASASTPRVYFTGTVDTRNHDKSYTFGNDTWHFRVKEVACFVATPLRKKDAHQPFCRNGVGRLMKTSGDHLNSNKPCFTAENQNYRPLDDAGIANPFFDFLYTMQNYTCKSKAHPEPRTYYPAPPGWILQYRSWKNNNTGTGLTDVVRRQWQYHWPVLDTKTLTCTTEPATGKTRSRFALNGRTTVPTMCGADFDAWFNRWIAPPAQSSVPQIAIPTISIWTEPKGGENMSTAIADVRPAELQASGPSSADALAPVRHHRGARTGDDLPRRLSP